MLYITSLLIGPKVVKDQDQYVIQTISCILIVTEKLIGQGMMNHFLIVYMTHIYAAVSQNYQILIIYAAIKLPNYKLSFIDK